MTDPAPASASEPSEGLAALREERVLVTGAGGFLGRHLCGRLVAAGARVLAVGRSGRPEGTGTPDPAIEWRRTEWRSADLADREAAAATVRWARPDRIVHLASVVKGSRDRALVSEMFRSNLESTVHLLDAATDHGVARFVHIGSLEEPEAGEVAVSPYAASKAAATLYAELFARLYDLPVALARVFMVYGPGPQDRAKLVPYVVDELLAGRRPMLSSGRREVDWIYVDDVVSGLCRMLVDPGAVGARLDLGSGSLTSVRDVVTRLAELIDAGIEPGFGELPDRDGEVVRRADVDRTEARVGWRPLVGLDEGLRRTVEAARSSSR